jgi:hypothetical protein
MHAKTNIDEEKYLEQLQIKSGMEATITAIKYNLIYHVGLMLISLFMFFIILKIKPLNPELYLSEAIKGNSG